jgi:hypothetical protein
MKLIIATATLIALNVVLLVPASGADNAHPLTGKWATDSAIAVANTATKRCPRGIVQAIGQLTPCVPTVLPSPPQTAALPESPFLLTMKVADKLTGEVTQLGLTTTAVRGGWIVEVVENRLRLESAAVKEKTFSFRLSTRPAQGGANNKPTVVEWRGELVDATLRVSRFSSSGDPLDAVPLVFRRAK